MLFICNFSFSSLPFHFPHFLLHFPYFYLFFLSLFQVSRQQFHGGKSLEVLEVLYPRLLRHWYKGWNKQNFPGLLLLGHWLSFVFIFFFNIFYQEWIWANIFKGYLSCWSDILRALAKFRWQLVRGYILFQTLTMVLDPPHLRQLFHLSDNNIIYYEILRKNLYAF